MKCKMIKKKVDLYVLTWDSLQRILLREELEKEAKMPNSTYNMILFMGGKVDIRVYAEENYRGI